MQQLSLGFWFGLGLLLAVPPQPVAALTRWLRVEAPSGLEQAQALSYRASGGRLAVGGERGVAVGPLAGPLERVLSRGPVRDLVFAGEALWAASAGGLYRVEAGGRSAAETPAPGGLARDVRALSASGDWLAAATAAGIFVRSATAGWRRVEGLPSGEGTRVVLLGASDEHFELWALLDGDLWRRSPEGRGARIDLPAAASGQGALDLSVSAGGELCVLLTGSIVRRDRDGSWRTEALVMPPGAIPHRLLAARGSLWLATDAGLLERASPGGPWRRAASPVGNTPVLALVAGDHELIVSTSQGLFRASEEREAIRAFSATDPPVQAVHRIALRYLELEPARMRALARAAGRSAWLPALSLRLDHERALDRGRDHDQSFVSGATRLLEDRERSRGEDLGASLVLSWDLGETVYDSDRIDVSRESRLVAQLRDDVLDEINQLYFERQRVLAALASPLPDDSPASLRLRAAELAAGIDAWTGGWFSAQLQARSSAAVAPAR